MPKLKPRSAKAKRSNPETIGKRIKMARGFYRISQAQLGRYLGITRAAVSQYEADQTMPRRQVVENLANYFRASPEWFAHGLGLPPRAPERSLTIPEIDLRLLTRRVTDLRHLRSDRVWAVPSSMLDASPDQLVVIYAADEALSPAIASGDHLIVDTRRVDFKAQEPQQLFLVLNGGERSLVCHLKAAPRDRVELWFDNPAYPPQTVKRADLMVLGQVVAYFRVLAGARSSAGGLR